MLVNALGHVAVTLAEDGEEERRGLFDLLEADVQRLVVVGLLLCHAPAQVNVHEVDAMLLQLLARRRKDDLHRWSRSVPHLWDRGTCC